jgi:antitoxin component YwqK of YwqJK toxin-antitoxin module
MEPVIEYYENGQKKLEYYLVNGVKQGVWTQWRENGKQETKGNYINGEKNGVWTWWHENGEKFVEGYFINDKKSGIWTGWDENGKKLQEGNYVDDKKSGIWTGLDENGKKVEESVYVNGRIVAWLFYDICGRKTRSGYHIFDHMKMIHYYWYTHGQKESEGWRINNKPEGVWTYWDDSEHTREISIWANDSKIISFSP